ncbi:Protein of unknown function [Gryllus bimaculatus]|nr:Protein of unknown function [Gryllus bimaculatus]
MDSSDYREAITFNYTENQHDQMTSLMFLQKPRKTPNYTLVVYEGTLFLLRAEISCHLLNITLSAGVAFGSCSTYFMATSSAARPSFGVGLARKLSRVWPHVKALRSYTVGALWLHLPHYFSYFGNDRSCQKKEYPHLYNSEGSRRQKKVMIDCFVAGEGKLHNAFNCNRAHLESQPAYGRASVRNALEGVDGCEGRVWPLLAFAPQQALRHPHHELIAGPFAGVGGRDKRQQNRKMTMLETPVHVARVKA